MKGHTPDSGRADEIYFAAFEIEDEAARLKYVTEARDADENLYRAVTQLLGMEAEAEALFQHGIPARLSASDIAETLTNIPEFFENMNSVLPDDDEVGKQIGNYKLLQKIGEGGVGSVYLAEQKQPVRRQVALKIIKAGMDTKSVIARFEAEHQALAMMEHPNIAHVLNAGITETGRPYFVMELVQGERITTYCDEHQLDIRQRLELFTCVCHAIQHAHKKGIAHRDIKPSNVLITLHNRNPCPVVIDFGIAKATGGDLLTDKTVNTQIGPFIGTPAYMSPEQADSFQTDIDMHSDIYSPGILLYELLSGSPPFSQKELMEDGIDVMRRTLREKQPPKPSINLNRPAIVEQKTVAQNRRSSPQKLGTMLANELDWIVSRQSRKIGIAVTKRSKPCPKTSHATSIMKRFWRGRPAGFTCLKSWSSEIEPPLLIWAL